MEQSPDSYSVPNPMQVPGFLVYLCSTDPEEDDRLVAMKTTLDGVHQYMEQFPSDSFFEGRYMNWYEVDEYTPEEGVSNA